MEITRGDNKDNRISILLNGQVVDITPSGKDFVNIHKTCFYPFDVKNDTIELRNADNGTVTISVNLMSEGVRTQLHFGKPLNSIWVALAGKSYRCESSEEMESDGMGVGRLDEEVSSFLKFKDGQVIQSACVGK